MENSMKTMNTVMPVFSAFMCLSFSIGIGIYWIAGALVRSVQQVIINRHMSSIDMDEVIRKNQEKAAKKREKAGLPPQKITQAATQSVRNIQVQENEEPSAEEKEAAIGCTDTHFVTPNGLDASDAGGDHHTTAADLARIMRYCVWISPKAAQFLAVTQTRSYTFWDLEKKNMFNCYNHNALLDQMDGAVSGKTGFTAKAGYCYTGALERDGKRLIVSLLACGWPSHKNYKWADAAKLLNYGLESYMYRDVLDHSWNPGQIEVADGVYDGMLQVKSSARLTLTSPALDPARSLPALLKETEIPEKDIFLPELLKAPVKKGEKVGSVTYSIDGILLAEYPVYAAETIEKIDYGWCMEKVAERLFCHSSV